MDTARTNQLTFPKLCRNSAGNRHIIASQQAAHGGRQRKPAGGSSSKESGGIGSNDGDDRKSAPDAVTDQVLKDVIKFKPNPLANTLTTNDNDDDDDDQYHPGSALNLDSTSSMTVLFNADVELVSVATSSSGARSAGRIIMNKSMLQYVRRDENEDYDFVNRSGNQEFLWACKNFSTTSWKLSEVLVVVRRRYQLREVGIEILFTSRQSIFINVKEIKPASKLFKLLNNKARCPNLVKGYLSLIKSQLSLASYVLTTSHAIGPATNAVTVDESTTAGTARALSLAWANRELSNFDYLMQLNSLAGRSFNDLGQYPVFPWVIADYTSPKLDFRDPKTFRDFRWPMGAQLESQREILREKFETIAAMKDCPPYHYGSHYSTSGFVIWYLIRMEPFTSLHVWLQDGKFDRPDRLFHSLEATYRGCTTNAMDVKELIPEFFYNPEILENLNHFDLGTTQNGQKIGPVILPPWAKNSHDFIRLHREALESDYVSHNLHHWIDLIFGYKQRPLQCNGSREAEHALNCFTHFSYADAVNLDDLRANDPQLYYSTIMQIENFGQTPMQLFDKPHPERKPLEAVNIIWPLASVVEGIHNICPNASSNTVTASMEAGSPYSAGAGPTAAGGGGGTGTSASTAAAAAATMAPEKPMKLIPPVIEKPQRVTTHDVVKVSSFPVLFIAELASFEKLVTVDSSRLIGYHQFKLLTPDLAPPYALKIDQMSLKVSETSAQSKRSTFIFKSSIKERRIGVPFASQGLLSSSLSAQVMAPVVRVYHDLIGTPQNKTNLIQSESDRLQRRDKMRESTRTIASSSSGSSGLATPPRPRLARGETYHVMPTSGLSSVTSSIQPTRSPAAASMTTISDAASDISITESEYSSHGRKVSRNDVGHRPIFSGSSQPFSASASSLTAIEGSRGGTNPTGSNSGDSSTKSTRSKKSSRFPDQRVDEHLSSHLFGVLPDHKILFSCGHWDNSFKATFIDTGKLIQSVSFHRDIVTCLAVASDFNSHWLVTGSRDCTVMVWELTLDTAQLSSAASMVPGSGSVVMTHPLFVLYGHDDVVTCLTVHAELDLICSGSEDGTIIMSSLRTGTYLRSIMFGAISHMPGGLSSNNGNSSSISSSSSMTSLQSSLSVATTHDTSSAVISSTGSSASLASSNVAIEVTFPDRSSFALSQRTKRAVNIIVITKETFMVAYSHDGNLLCTYSINGRLMRMVDAGERLYCIQPSEDGKVILTGGERCLVVLRWTSTLALANSGPRKDLETVLDGAADGKGPISSPIRSMRLSTQERLLIVGLESGEVRILAQDSGYLRRRLHRKLEEIGILPRNELEFM